MDYKRTRSVYIRREPDEIVRSIKSKSTQKKSHEARLLYSPIIQNVHQHTQSQPQSEGANLLRPQVKLELTYIHARVFTNPNRIDPLDKLSSTTYTEESFDDYYGTIHVRIRANMPR